MHIYKCTHIEIHINILCKHILCAYVCVCGLYAFAYAHFVAVHVCSLYGKFIRMVSGPFIKPPLKKKEKKTYK